MLKLNIILIFLFLLTSITLGENLFLKNIDDLYMKSPVLQNNVNSSGDLYEKI